MPAQGHAKHQIEDHLKNICQIEHSHPHIKAG